MEAVAVASLLFLFGILAVHWTSLPERVPTHFGPSGQPDRWGGRGMAWVLPVLGLVLYAQLTAVARYTELISLPVSVDRDDPEVRRLLRDLAAVLKAVVVVTFAYIEWVMLDTALGGSHGLGQAFLPVSLGAVAIVLAVYVIKLRRYRRA